MNATLVNRIADAVLYEGYILYPYRPSVKNRRRWTFGGLYPESWCHIQGAGDASSSQTECLVHGTPATTFEVAVRFLHLTARIAGEIDPPLREWPASGLPSFRPVEALRVGDKLLQTWQEAEEREVTAGPMPLAELLSQPVTQRFSFAGGRRAEPVRQADGLIRGILVREQQAIDGIVELSAVKLEEELFRVTLRITNCTSFEEAGCRSRDEALLCSLVSAHSILGVAGGEFVSLLDPPDCWRNAAATCRNIGCWPIMVGAEGQRDTMLSSPIILYDHPQIAPESPGSFFDGTEIDEMLTLRIMTLTDEEKQAMASVDERARILLSRTEAMAREKMLGLHGTFRPVEPAAEVANYE